MNLEGLVALVTASGRGIGRGIAESLAQAGASLVINSYSEETVNETARRCKALGAEVSICVGDITDRDKIIEMRDGLTKGETIDCRCYITFEKRRKTFPTCFGRL